MLLYVQTSKSLKLSQNVIFHLIKIEVPKSFDLKMQ